MNTLLWTLLTITSYHQVNSLLRPESENELQNLIISAGKNESALKHSRKRRYVVFPEGSTFTVALCLQQNVYDPIFSDSVNWALAFDLPNETIHAKQQRENKLRQEKLLLREKRNVFGAFETLLNSVKALTGIDSIFTTGVNWALSYDLPNETMHDVKKPVPLRRHRRQLYERVGILLNSAGYDGRTCVLRTICETAQLIPPRQGVIHEIIRLLFTYEFSTSSPQRRKQSDYSIAHADGISDTSCYDLYPCPISLLDLLLQFGVKQTP